MGRSYWFPLQFFREEDRKQQKWAGYQVEGERLDLEAAGYISVP